MPSKNSGPHHWLPFLIAAAIFLAYLPGLGARVLVTDEAKDALNAPYPHPPLARGLMFETQRAFGWTESSARLPIALSGALLAGLLSAILLKRRLRPGAAALATALFAAAPGIASWSRSGYLSIPLAAAWTLALYGIVLAEDRPDDRQPQAASRKPQAWNIAGFWLLFTGYALGLFTQLQAVLFIPACLWCCWAWRARIAADRRVRTIFWLSLLASVAFFVYVASEPQILQTLFDTLKVTPASESASWAGNLRLLSTTYLWPWCAAGLAVALAYAWSFRRELGRPFRASLLCLAAAALLWIVTNPAEYYLPYFALPVWIMAAELFARVGGGWMKLPAVALIAAGFVAVPSSQLATQLQEFYSTRAAEWRPLVADDASVVFLGDYGYEAQYYSPAPVRKMPANAELRAGIRHALIVEPGSTSPEEDAWLAEEFIFLKEVGAVKVYERK